MKVYEAINKALDEAMSEDNKIYLIGEEVGKSGGTYKVTQKLYDKYGPSRVCDMPISEPGFTGLAVGSSFSGLIPCCEFMTWNFALQSIDHIVNSCAKMRYMSGGIHSSSIVFRGPNGFSSGVGAQHTQDFCAWYGSVPGLKVIAPFSANDHYYLTKLALKDGNPIVILENEMLYEKEFELDKNCKREFKSVVEKEGDKLTIIGISLNVELCIEAAKKFEGIEVINLLSIRPIDFETILKSVNKTRRLIIVDNAYPMFNVSGEIAAYVSEKCFGKLLQPVKRISGADCPTAYAINLENLSFPRIEDIKSSIAEMLK
ncbi:pyruvate dehydrogenase E1 [Gurleya vavrai]